MVVAAAGAAAGCAASRSANAPAARFSSSAIRPVLAIPKRRTSTASVAMAPSIAPSVFQPYSLPTIAPKRESDRDSASVNSGSVAPIAVVGSTSSTNALPNRAMFKSHGVSAITAKSGASAADSRGSASTTRKLLTPMPSSSSAYSLIGCVIRDCKRATRPLPSVRPLMNAASTRLALQTLLPSVSPASLNQSVSNVSPALPDRKKIRTRARGIGNPLEHHRINRCDSARFGSAGAECS